jgi:hypothetical protein
VEWARARARKERWTEEAILNTEEMRRNIAYSQWQQTKWLDIAEALHNDDPVALEGKRAYALEHADYKLRLTRHCVAKWLPVVACARASKLLKDHIVDPFVGVSVDTETPITSTKGKGRATENNKRDTEQANKPSSTLELAVGDSEGLALSTNEGEYSVPRCVSYYICCSNSTNVALVQLAVGLVRLCHVCQRLRHPPPRLLPSPVPLASPPHAPRSRLEHNSARHWLPLRVRDGACSCRRRRCGDRHGCGSTRSRRRRRGTVAAAFADAGVVAMVLAAAAAIFAAPLLRRSQTPALLRCLQTPALSRRSQTLALSRRSQTPASLRHLQPSTSSRWCPPPLAYTRAALPPLPARFALPRGARRRRSMPLPPWATPLVGAAAAARFVVTR